MSRAIARERDSAGRLLAVTNEQSDLELAPLINQLRGTTSFGTLANAISHRVGEQTMIRLGDYNRPFRNPVQPETLVGMAEAINRATDSRTSAWALWIAHGVQFERTVPGFTGRPRRADLDALTLLFADWHRLTPARLAAWNRGGVALLAEQTAEDEIDRLRAENDQLRAELSARDNTPPAAKAQKQGN